MHPSSPSIARDESLASAEEFVTRSLPRVVHALCRLAGARPPILDDLVDEVRQDVYVDALENAAEVAALPPPARRDRWMTLASRSRYRHAVRPGRRRSDTADAIEWLPGLLAETPWPELPAQLRDLAAPLAQLIAHARRLDNGRLATLPTARAAGMSPGEVRALWAETARRLGYGPEHERFWVRRLAETLTAIAAARLVAARRVRVWDARARRRPDPNAETRRLARIRRMLEVRPMPAEARRVLARVAGRAARPALDAPRALLEMAVTLAPDDVAVRLWQFEAALADGDLPAAARALRAAHATRREAARVTLARARLLEVRGRHAAAARLLERALARAPGDRRLAASRQALGPAPRERSVRRHAPSSRSAASSARPSWRSKPA